ncbi:MAG: glycosyltransferase, partial [Methylococcaceae bacterium]|nr:glycosyltransferase [Methylococcaceae bacterium]
HRLRLWDLASSYRVDYFIANSSFVQKRIQKFYHRDSEVIFPPINTEDFYSTDKQADYYLMVGQLVKYKNTQLAIDSFNQNKKRLVIIGVGKELEFLKNCANENITFLGYQSFDAIKDYYAQCKALIFPGIEDFGMVPVEAMASGRPVIALAKGGALDSIVKNETGVFFEEATVASLNKAIDYFESNQGSFDSKKIIDHANKFDSEVFKLKFSQFVQNAIKY